MKTKIRRCNRCNAYYYQDEMVQFNNEELCPICAQEKIFRNHLIEEDSPNIFLIKLIHQGILEKNLDFEIDNKIIKVDIISITHDNELKAVIKKRDNQQIISLLILPFYKYKIISTN